MRPIGQKSPFSVKNFSKKMSHIVAIIGRPNVGKSTFYNRMVGGRPAIVDDFSGVTRDRQYGVADWNGRRFTVVDTGGFIGDSEDVFAAAIRSQVKIAIEEAQVIIFMVDATTGITDLDTQVAELLRRNKKTNVLLVVNKVDNKDLYSDAQEFWALGIDNMFCVASISGSGTGDLLDEVVNRLPEEAPEESDLPKITIVGRPNAGKSSLVNALLGEDRTIVTDIAGTTRDSIHTHYNKFGMEFMLVDTAGLRKKKNVKEDLEFYSVLRTIKAIEESDVCVLMLDATQGLEAQDINIFRLIVKNKKGVVLLVNKWDLIENKEANTAKQMEDKIKERLAPFNDVPIIFTSVNEKQRIFKAIETAMEVYQNRTIRITTSKLNDFIGEVTAHYPPPAYRGKLLKIKYVTQLPTPYPSFVFFCNHPDHVAESYKNYLENQFRQRFNLCGTPMVMYFREK